MVDNQQSELQQESRKVRNDASSDERLERRRVLADLVEAEPENGGLSYWILASPALLFLAWVWTDLFAHYSPVPNYWVDAVIGLVVLIALVILPLGLGAFFVVTAFPKLFGNAGWVIHPLEPVREAEQYMVRYDFRNRQRAQSTWTQTMARAGQGWVYLEIAGILLGGVLLVPVFLSATEFGFGQ